jgi:Ulp1 family protease
MVDARRRITQLLSQGTEARSAFRSLDEESLYKRLIAKGARYDAAIEKMMSFSRRKPSLLTQTMLNEVEKIWSIQGAQTEICSGFGVTLTLNDFMTLLDQNWVNDEIINFYGQLLLQNAQNEGRKLHIFSSFFYTKLSSQGYKSVSRWTRKFDLFELDKVIFPVHLGNHWCVGALDMKIRRLEYYDSLHGSSMEFFPQLRKYLQAEYLEKHGKSINLDDWNDFYPKVCIIPQVFKLALLDI